MNNIEDKKLRRKQRMIEKCQKEALNSLWLLQQKIEGWSDKMSFFYKSIEEAYSYGRENYYKDKTVIGTMCINVPEELIYAVGAVPIKLCSGAYACEQAGSEIMPAKSCPLVKSLAGSIQLNRYLMNVSPSLIVNPTTCDQKKKLHDIVDEEGGEYYIMELPSVKDTEEAQLYWRQSVYKLAEKLQKLTSKKITNKSLKEAILRVSNAQKVYKRILELRKKANVIFGTDMILISNTYFFSDIDEWTKNLEILAEDLEVKIEKEEYVCDKNSVRILIAGSPSIFPNMKLPLLIEDSGAIIVADEFCSSNRMLYDMAAVDEWKLYDMIPALADKYLKPNTCPNFTPNEDRKRKILQMVKDYKVDGVVYQNFSGCQLFDIESYSIGKMLKENDIPMLSIETDYSPDDKGQLSTRIEAFIDSLKFKK